MTAASLKCPQLSLQEELGVRAARLKGITDVVPVSRNGSADSDSGDEDSDVKKGVSSIVYTNLSRLAQV